MSTSWKSQQGKGEYALQFETDDDRKYKLVEKAAQMAMDGKTADDLAEVKHSEWKLYADGSGKCKNCNTHQKAVWDMNGWQNFCGHCGADMRGEAR